MPATKNEKTYEGFSEDERAAMKERAKEIKTRATKKDGETALLEKIAEMSESDRAIAEGLHAIVKAVAPDLTPKTYYGMPAYARGGKNVCFFQSKDKFKTRYSTIGFEEAANLDDGAMWAASFAVTEWTADVEKRITALVRQAVR